MFLGGLGRSYSALKSLIFQDAWAEALSVSGPGHLLMSVCCSRHSRNRNYKAEFASCRLEAVPLEFGDYHPLKPITVSSALGVQSLCSDNACSESFLRNDRHILGSFLFCQWQLLLHIWTQLFILAPFLFYGPGPAHHHYYPLSFFMVMRSRGVSIPDVSAKYILLLNFSIWIMKNYFSYQRRVLSWAAFLDPLETKLKQARDLHGPSLLA